MSNPIITATRTESSKPDPSQNALKTGLYSTTDLILDAHESEAYQALREETWQKLAPEGPFEETFACEILSATWRLRRCRLLEAELAPSENNPANASEEDLANRQKSIDRARSQAHRLLTRSLSELRKLQTEAVTREQLQTEGLRARANGGLIDSARFVQTLRNWNQHWVELQTSRTDAQIAEKSFCKSPTTRPDSAPSTPRNALCPCNSGAKFKRCCGKNAPPVLGMAA